MARLSLSPKATDPTAGTSLPRTTTTSQTRNVALGTATIPRDVNGSGLSTGNIALDQILDRLHSAFSELAHVETDPSEEADTATSELASTYGSLTGRALPEGFDTATILANGLRQQLSTVPAGLTDGLGQQMLRTL